MLGSKVQVPSAFRLKPAGAGLFRVKVRVSPSTSVASSLPPMAGASSTVVALLALATGASFTGVMFRVMLSVSLSLPSLVLMVRVSWPL